MSVHFACIFSLALFFGRAMRLRGTHAHSATACTHTYTHRHTLTTRVHCAHEKVDKRVFFGLAWYDCVFCWNHFSHACWTLNMDELFKEHCCKFTFPNVHCDWEKHWFSPRKGQKWKPTSIQFRAKASSTGLKSWIFFFKFLWCIQQMNANEWKSWTCERSTICFPLILFSIKFYLLNLCAHMCTYAWKCVCISSFKAHNGRQTKLHTYHIVYMHLYTTHISMQTLGKILWTKRVCVCVCVHMCVWKRIQVLSNILDPNITHYLLAVEYCASIDCGWKYGFHQTCSHNGKNASTQQLQWQPANQKPQPAISREFEQCALAFIWIPWIGHRCRCRHHRHRRRHRRCCRCVCCIAYSRRMCVCVLVSQIANVFLISIWQKRILLKIVRFVFPFGFMFPLFICFN